MKKRSVIAALLCSLCLTAGGAVPAMADSARVVTLGADLTQDQKDTMMRYFKTDASQVQILTITNQDEREHLGDYIPLEQIGTRTLSCAYVKPTQSGGIKVRTANLNYVTGNMIANALSTAGVTNCEAVAACPYEVSGTGALTGVIMAYESASGQKLDSTKKDLATKEVVVTGDLAQQVGNDNATNIINQAKLQIIGDNIQNADEIYNIVNNIAVQNNVTLSQEEMETIVALLQEIAQQSYDIEQMKETLENIQQNLDKEAADDPVFDGTAQDDGVVDAEDDNLADEDSTDGEDITQNVDPDALGEDIKESSTEDPSLQEETMGEAVEGEDGAVDEETGIPEATEDGTALDGTAQDDMAVAPEENTEEIPEATEDGTVLDGTAQDDMSVTPEENTAEDPLNTDSLSEEAKASFEQAKSFCKGEYEGDTASLQSVMGEDAMASVTITPEVGADLTQKVLESYIKVLKDGGMSYVPADTDIYLSAELNMVNAEMRLIFSMELDPAEDDILVNETPETRQALYSDTMKFFENLYGESSVSAETTQEEVME
ncbi:MAG: DUF1002 domain-containing protein [Lachnospiraceae bacterium]|nr:DUF1002 domain-containing protein [Lachnospiraceae bacterium]